MIPDMFVAKYIFCQSYFCTSGLDHSYLNPVFSLNTFYRLKIFMLVSRLVLTAMEDLIALHFVLYFTKN